MEWKKAYKGFNADMTCRGFQFKEGGKYHEDCAKLCECGFHADEVPMDVFTYYPPTTSVYHEVEIGGDTGERRPNEDSKFVGTDIKIGASLDVAGLINAHVGFVKSKAESAAQGNCGHAAAQGNRGHAAAQGDQGHAAAQGDRGHAAAQGDCGHAAAQGYCGHAAAQGDCGHAEVHGKDAIAAAFGIRGQAKGEIGDWLVLAEWKCTDTWHIETVKTVLVDGEKIKANTWYKLQGGEFVEVEE